MRSVGQQSNEVTSSPGRQSGKAKGVISPLKWNYSSQITVAVKNQSNENKIFY